MAVDQTVRDAALALQAAITDAVAAGYRVEWPSRVIDLDHIAVSETAKVVQPATEPVVPVSAEDQPAAASADAVAVPRKSRFSGL